MMRVKTRRLALAGAAVTVGAMLLSACGGGSSSSGSGSGDAQPSVSDQPVTITATWWGGDKRADLTNQAIAAFEAKHPNITVTGQFKDWNGYWDTLATSTAAGDAADVIQMDELYLASYGDRGALYDLSQVSNTLDTADIPKEALDTGKIGDTQYAAPIGIGVYAIVANADLFNQYGIPLPDDDTWTWDDFAAVAKQISEKSGGAVYGAQQIGGFDAGSLKYWARSAGSEVFDADGKVTLDPAALAAMWQFQIDQIAAGGITPASTIVESQAAGLAGSSLATGKAAMGVAYNTQITALRDSSGADLRLLKLPEPAGTHPASLKPSMYWAISSQSEHPAEAAEFIDFMLNDPAAADILGTERGIPANTTIQQHLTANLSESDKLAVEYQDRVTPGAAPVVTPNGASDIEKILGRYTQEVLFGQTSPQDGATAFIAELQGEVNSAG